MTRSLVALAVTAMLAVPATSSAATAKKATAKPAKEQPAKADPKKAEPAKADAKPADAKDAKPVDAKDAKPAAVKAEPKQFQTIGKLGLKFEGPKMAQSDMSGQVMCSDDHGLAFTVGPTTEFSVKTFEEAKLSKNDYSPTNVQKEVKLDDGWNIQFQNRGAMGDNYFVWIRRTLGGKAFQCETTANTAEQAAKVEKICLSLSK